MSNSYDNTCSLTEIFGFSELVEHYNKNKNKKLCEWLEFNKMFKRGKQGITGLLAPTDSESKNLKFVFKISQYINYLIQHEYSVMKGLNELSPYCPHFCKVIGTLLCEIDPKCKKDGNPFEITTKYPIEKEVLLTEYVEDSTKFYNYIKNTEIHEDILYSTIKQVLIAITIAQQKKQFAHYDLHSYNVMMKTCDKNVVFLYVLDKENQFCVPTFGHYPVIIDFGFSYIKDMDNGPCWPSMSHTHAGFMSDRFDHLADPKLFLVTVADDLKEKRDSKKTTKFRNIVKNIFGTLKIDWEAGWDEVEDRSATEHVADLLNGHNEYSNIFDNYDYYCLDLIQSLIILPLQKQNYTDIDISYKTFLKEFVKIENEIGNPFYNLYILKGIIDIARDVRADYLNKKAREHALSYFRKSVYERINCVSKYCRPKDIHFERMLCSLFCLSKSIEGILYNVISKRMKDKEKEYSELPLQTIEQIYGVLEVNIESKYIFNEKTVVFVMNCVDENCSRLELTQSQCDEINDLHSLNRGSFLYNLVKNQE